MERRHRRDGNAPGRRRRNQEDTGVVPAPPILGKVIRPSKVLVVVAGLAAPVWRYFALGAAGHLGYICLSRRITDRVGPPCPPLP
jgi:hypothetical protein